MKRHEPAHEGARAVWRILYEILQCVNATVQMLLQAKTKKLQNPKKTTSKNPTNDFL